MIAIELKEAKVEEKKEVVVHKMCKLFMYINNLFVLKGFFFSLSKACMKALKWRNNQDWKVIWLKFGAKLNANCFSLLQELPQLCPWGSRSRSTEAAQQPAVTMDSNQVWSCETLWVWSMALPEERFDWSVNLGWINKGFKKCPRQPHSGPNGPVHYRCIVKSLEVSMSP